MRTCFFVGKERLDPLDLKALIVTQGIKVSQEVYERFGGTHRIYPDPLTCNCLILPDGTIVQMTDVALHMRYRPPAQRHGNHRGQLSKGFAVLRTDTMDLGAECRRIRDFYRRVKEGLAEIYPKYGLEPPGSRGLNVCLCRDIWHHRSVIGAATGQC
ncbi:MAG TPA: hypothetical protein VLI39_10565 [Sedimentisphaerales bacterium]|nr:hypothetical protein [Sedimentisphaerales bacterium]